MRSARGVLLRTPLLVLVAAAVAVGVGVAALVTTFETPRYRAESSLVVQRGTQPVTGGGAAHGLVRTIGDLGRSDTVAQDVIRNLALHESSQSFWKNAGVAEDDDSAFLLLHADASNRTRAQQIVAQLGIVLTQLARQRFGQVSPTGGEPVQVVGGDQPHVLAGRLSPNLWRNLGWGALFGLVAGLFLANAAVRGRPPRAAIESPPVLGEDFDEIADRLVEVARERPFQTLVVAGDPDGRVAEGLSAGLASRGVTSTSARASLTDAAGIDALAARHAFVLVAADSLDPSSLPVTDAVLAVSDGSPVPLALVLGLRGARLLGVVRPGGGTA